VALLIGCAPTSAFSGAALLTGSRLVAEFCKIALAAGAARLWTGFVAGHAYDFVVMGAYNCSTVVWLVYVLMPEKVHRNLKDLPQNDLEQWNAELQRLLLQ
jgi:hypothetical protein